MPTRIYWLHTFTTGSRIGIMPRPRGNDWLEDEITSFKRQHVGMLISLLEKEEVLELGLVEEETLCKIYGIRYKNFPITDRSIPVNNEKVKNFVNEIYDALLAGIHVVIHCRMGIGRSTIMAGAVIMKEGIKADDILSNTSKIRGISVPDTNDQVMWLKWFEKNG